MKLIYIFNIELYPNKCFYGVSGFPPKNPSCYDLDFFLLTYVKSFGKF